METTTNIAAAVQSGWPQVLAVFAVIWWCRKIDLQNKDHAERLDRHDRRIAAVEQSQHNQALQLARIEESLSGIKLTLDRIYAEIHAKD